MQKIIVLLFAISSVTLGQVPEASKNPSGNPDYDPDANRPYVLALENGGISKNDDGSVQMSSSISYVFDGPDCQIIVDTGVPADTRLILRDLSANGILPTDITLVVSTHYHPDHIGNLNLFTYATYIVSNQTLNDKNFRPIDSVKLTSENNGYEIRFLCPNVALARVRGHTTDDNVVLVLNATDYGNVAITGDIFVCEDDIKNENIWRETSAYPIEQKEARRLIIADSDYIVPGHGKPFRVTDDMRNILLNDKGVFMESATGKNVPEYHQIRRAAFLAVVVSTVAAVGCVISLPLMYNYVQRLHSHAELELDFCKSRTRDMWIEMITIKQSSWHSPTAVQAARQRRQWLFGQWQNVASGVAFLGPEYAAPQGPPGAPGQGQAAANAALPAVEVAVPSVTTASPNAATLPPAPLVTAAPPGPPSEQVSCACGTGEPGPPGPAGDAGKDGKDGETGNQGPPGKAALCPPGPPADECITCMPGSAGPAGHMGEKGPPGPKGAPGAQGVNGKTGPRGMIGSEGPPGPPGGPGPKGPVGDTGPITFIDGPVGPPGPPGTDGQKGPPGSPGSNGKDFGKGPAGQPGDAGEAGQPGKPGLQGKGGPKGKFGSPGPCSHCPTPRTAPGY